MFEYKGYYGGRLDVDENGFITGSVLGLRDVITFAGKTVDELNKAFRDSIDDYLEWCAERGKAPEKPYSGKFQVRVKPEMHRRIAAISEAKAMSMNAWVVRTLNEAIERAGS